MVEIDLSVVSVPLSYRRGQRYSAWAVKRCAAVPHGVLCSANVKKYPVYQFFMWTKNLHINSFTLIVSSLFFMFYQVY